MIVMAITWNILSEFSISEFCLMSNRIQAEHLSVILDSKISEIKQIGSQDVKDCSKDRIQNLLLLLDEVKRIFNEQAKLSAAEKDNKLLEFSSLINRKNNISREVEEFKSHLLELASKNNALIGKFNHNFNNLQCEKERLMVTHKSSVDGFVELIEEKRQELLESHAHRFNSLGERKIALIKELSKLQKENKAVEKNLITDYENARSRLKMLELSSTDNKTELREKIHRLNEMIQNDDQERDFLEAHFERVDTNAMEQQRENKILSLRINLESVAEKTFDDSASKIQCIIRGKCARKTFEILRKKKKTKKGKVKRKN